MAKNSKRFLKKFLKVSFPEKCIGCELCVAETQRQLNIAGLEGSLIRILKENAFLVQVDPGINKLNIQKIIEICPTGVFTIEEKEDADGLTG
jgi:NAD-dependent dihydropyrimidine dehydrogenase PreA subunit